MPRISKSLIDAAAIGGDIEGSFIDSSGATQAALVATISGGASPTGTVTFQGSNDVPTGASDFEPTNWGTVRDAAGNDVTISFTDNATKCSASVFSAFRWLRATWTNTSGTGTLTVKIHAVGP